MKEGNVESVAKRLQLIDAVFAASLYFGLDQNNHTLSLGLLICWIGIRCSQQIWKVRHNKAWTEKNNTVHHYFRSHSLSRKIDHPIRRQSGRGYLYFDRSLPVSGLALFFPSKKSTVEMD